MMTFTQAAFSQSTAEQLMTQIQKTGHGKALERHRLGQRAQVDRLIGYLGDSDSSKRIRALVEQEPKDVQMGLMDRCGSAAALLNRLPPKLRVPMPVDPDEYLKLLLVTWWNDLVGLEDE